MKHHYQGLKLSKYNKSFSAVEESYHIAIVAVIDSMESRFRKFHGTIYEE